jgi:gluconate 2-dehydrogenase gamma chain
MSEISRRDAVRRLAMVLASTGAIDAIGGQTIHAMTAEAQAAAGGAYTPKTFTAAQYRLLERLADLIIPVEGGKPGALAAGCAAWIDMISSENDRLKSIYNAGFTWLDQAMKTRGAADFVSATPAQQTELLDLIAYRRNKSEALAQGIEFFEWVRRMTVDAFYTSEIGFKDIDYRGNAPAGSFPSPVESIEYAVKRAGL